MARATVLLNRLILLNLSLLLAKALLSSLTIHLMAEGRQLGLAVVSKSNMDSKALLDTWSRRVSNSQQLQTRNEERAMKRIGSRPPSCNRYRCAACGHCEAVRVPISPSKKTLWRFGYYRSNEILDYTPMSWKCRCGDFYFNPW